LHNGGTKSATLSAHAVFASVNRPSDIRNSAVIDKLRNALLPHHLELTMTICKCPQPPTYSQIKIDGNAEAGYKLSHSAAYMDFTFCSASVTGGAGCWEGGLGLSTMVSCLHSSSCKIEIMSLTNSQRITFRCS